MIRLFQFLGLGFVLLMMLNGLSWLIDDGGQQRRMQAALRDVEGRDAVTLGGSVGIGLRYPQMCVDGADFYWDGQDLFEVAAVADLILDRPNPPRLWIVVAAPTAQSYDNGASASERGARRREFHRLLFRHGRFGTIGGDWRQVLVTALTPALGYDAWAARFHTILNRVGLAAPAPQPDEAARDRRMLEPAAAAASAEAFIEQQSAHLERMAYYDGSIPRRAEQALVRMNQRIASSGGTMILVTPPMTEAVRAETEREMGEQVRGFDAMLGRLAADGVAVSNHWRDPAFGRRYDLFADNQHLNGAGAKEFSRVFVRELRDRGVLPAVACNSGQGAVKGGLPHNRRT
ncbi:hypothetical protein N0B44_06575 [Roseibacterium beibuensis]|uniref:hypothetical protein n=1 Tax=[Roseibacterium] beibuensis TaxID=1193142 RepID=UPI00217CE2E8|nr:hypothetical protein [Roseibacterium beibuensis]MCS6622567.1 hypothetical protein [Roseibacterium beibuensis]